MSESTYKSIAAAMYLVVGAERYAGGLSSFPQFHGEKEAHDELSGNPSALTESQRTALFSYLFLYSRLHKSDEHGLGSVKKAMSIPSGVVRNLEATITESRLEHIRRLYKSKRKDFLGVFKEPEGFIVKLIEDVVSLKVPEEKKRLKGLKALDYEHEDDKKKLEMLKSQTLLSSVVKKFNDYAVERVETISLTGSNFLATEGSLPSVHNALTEVCKTLDMHRVPPLYIESGGINAYTLGTKNPIICLHSGSLSLLTHDELLFLLGHEIGHIKSGHCLYHSMAGYLAKGGELVGDFTFGLGNLLTTPITAALNDWHRKSELSADRAGLLACQNPEAAFTFFTKLAGYPLRHYASINPGAILAQARKFEDLDSDSYNKVAKWFANMGASHPWTIMRAKELDRWVESGRYKGILNKIALTGGSYADCGGGKSGRVSFSGTGHTEAPSAEPSAAASEKPSPRISINFKR